MITQNFGVTNKEHYGMLQYFWSGQLRLSGSSKIEFDSNCSTANEIIVNKTKTSNYFLHLITLLIRQAERMATEIK